ncbi:MAG: contractile injection system tape measure protein [Draconibacterium sp.]
MDTSEHIVLNSSIQLNYRNKATAIRCNQLIESIFHSDILPEMEAAVSTSIPKGVNIELSKLEINIGEIPEKELSTVLARRIREELEKSRNFSHLVNIKGNSRNGFKQLTSENALLYALDFFLQYGFFPYSLENNPSLDELLAGLIESHPKKLIEILLSHKTKNHGISRLTNHLNQQSQSQLVVLLEPVDGKWIVNIVPKILQIAGELNIARSQKELLRSLMSSVLYYLLNNRSPGFSRQRFLVSAMKDWLTNFSPPDSTESNPAFLPKQNNDLDEILIYKAFKNNCLSPWVKLFL